jgi:hypothetical protein
VKIDPTLMEKHKLRVLENRVLRKTQLVLLAKYHYNDQVKHDVMGLACGMNGNQEECMYNFGQKAILGNS